MKREQKIERARQLRAAGSSYREIASHLGVGNATVCRWLNPKSAEGDRLRSRAWRERNRERVRTYNRRYDATHKGTCSRCRGPMHRNHDGGICRECRHVVRHERFARLAELWNAGIGYPEIQAALELKRGQLSALLVEARSEGYSLPYRKPRAAPRFPEQRAA